MAKRVRLAAGQASARGQTMHDRRAAAVQPAAAAPAVKRILWAPPLNLKQPPVRPHPQVT
jgi:hypothetical protein